MIPELFKINLTIKLFAIFLCLFVMHYFFDLHSISIEVEIRTILSLPPFCDVSFELRQLPLVKRLLMNEIPDSPFDLISLHFKELSLDLPTTQVFGNIAHQMLVT